MALFKPAAGYRTYRMLQLCLLANVAVAVLGIFKSVDLIGLAGLLTAISAPVIAGQAYKSVGSIKAGKGSEGP